VKGWTNVVRQPTIKLERFAAADVDRLIAWIPSAEFLLQWAGPAFHFPLDRAQLMRHLAAAEKPSPDRLIFKAVNPHTRETVGHGELGGIDRRNLSASIARVLVGSPHLRGQGLGEQIISELLVVAFQELALHRVSLNVFDFNSAAIRCYDKVGFRREGTLREARRHGDVYWNVCVMSILEHEFIAADTQRVEGVPKARTCT
jgi:RimJ/RimL family protein N-acetyltransferase